MKLRHSAIRSAIYELVTIHEVDIKLGDDFSTMRCEIFRNTQKKGRFRCRIWEGETHRLTPTFPQKNGKPLHISDALGLVEWLGGPGMGKYDDFAAPSVAKALQVVWGDFKKFLAPYRWEPLMSHWIPIYGIMVASTFTLSALLFVAKNSIPKLNHRFVVASVFTILDSRLFQVRT